MSDETELASLLATLKSTQLRIVQCLQKQYGVLAEPPSTAFGWAEDELRSYMMASSGGGAPCVDVTPLEAQPVDKKSADVPPTWGWGMFCSALTACEFSCSSPVTLVIVGGKLPLASKGPIVWLEGAPDAVAPSAAKTIVPVGGADSNAHAVDIPAGADDLVAIESRINAQCPNGFKWVAPRDLVVLPMMRRSTVAEVEAVVRAASLLAWHRAHAFNGADGAPTDFAPNTLGRRRKLASGRSVYPRVDPVAIVLCVSADGERVLLGRQKAFPPGMFTCISGFVEHGESVERAAAREVLDQGSHSAHSTRHCTSAHPSHCGVCTVCEAGARGDECRCGFGRACRVAAVAVRTWRIV